MGKVVVSGLGKAYRQYPSQWSRLAEWVFPGTPRHSLHWILKDVSFTVNPGEAVGIAGVNGAGKSTLLKMLTGTVLATEGSFTIEGRVAALLELGTGFHHEFTGRQNVLMSGQLLGLTANEVTELMPSIEAFAEIGDYIDQPVRTYSSGMAMRLAFSVATARRPDVLIIDEALSVGDAYFQHKSFDRIRQMNNEGSTLLIVSHDRNAIQTICDSVVLLDRGRVAKQGKPEDVMDYYNALIAEKEHATIREQANELGRVSVISGTGEASIESVGLYNAAGNKVEMIEVGEPVCLRVRARVNQDIPALVLGYMIKDQLGQPIYGINTYRVHKVLNNLVAGEVIEYRFEFDANIGKGHYSVALSLSKSDSHLDKNYEWRDRGLIFHVVNSRRENFVGCAWLNAKVNVSRNPVLATVCE